MKIKRMWLMAVLGLALALGLGAVEARTGVGGRVCPGDPDYWLDGLASDYIGYTVVAYMDPVRPLDAGVCIGLALPVGGGYYRWHSLECADRNGPGGPEIAREYIDISDFPDFSWLLNARLAFEVYAYWASDCGYYSLDAWTER